MKTVALGVGTVVLVSGGAAAYLVATFDPNAHKQALVDWVQQEKQRTLTLHGPIELGLWPRLHVRLQDVSLSEHQRPAEFARLSELDLAVQVMPLFKGQLRVGQVHASGVKLNYRRDAQGRSNIDDLLTPSDKPDNASQGQDLSFDVEGISLKDVQADVQDERSGVKALLTLAELQSGRLADGLATDLVVAAQAQLSAPRVAKVAVKGSLTLTPELKAQRFSASKLDLSVLGQTSTHEGQAAQADLKADIQAAKAVWDGRSAAATADDLAVTLSGQVGQGAGALLLDKADLVVAQFAFDPKAQALTVSKLDAKVLAHQDGHVREVEAQWPELSVKGDQLKGSALQGRFSVAGPVAVSGQFKSGSPVGSFQAIRLPDLGVDFKVTMAGQGGQREVSGQLKGQLSAQPQTLAGTLEGLKLQARISEPSLQPLVVNIAGRLHASAPTSADWSLQGDINSNAFTTTGKAMLGQGAPRIDAKAKFASLDLNRLLPARPASQAPASGGGLDKTVVDLSALRSVNGHFDVTAGQLAWQQYRVSDAVILAQLDQGRLTLQQLSGGAWGGRFKAQGSAQAGQQRVALQATAEGVNILNMLKDVAGKDILEGTGQVKLEVSTSGGTVGALTSGLNGTAAVVLRDGAVRGINLAKSLREAKSRFSSHSDAVEKAKQTEKTDFTEMTGSFVITQGVARNEDLSAKSPFLRVGGKGDIDLVQRRINYTVNATVTGTVKGQDGADIDGLKGLTVPVKLSGPFDALDWKIAWSGVALGSMQNTLKGQLDTKLDKAGGKLEDQLKAKLLGKPAAAASGASAASAPALSAEDAAKEKLKSKLKGLFR
ncbi:MAG TPA: AsmA family protein [Aquabacterium sp.]|uniref:AsmA family protein n=1 Tax=Aquabacterium sp. TaxID=1872578 RepID=UPI002E372C70|nr:AsmA family protein [Aquabacterium sp.]HEX5374479.1 AsmA family protein [Aquabacterium sp.]